MPITMPKMLNPALEYLKKEEDLTFREISSSSIGVIGFFLSLVD